MLLDALRASMGVEDEIDFPTYLIILQRRLQRKAAQNEGDHEFDVDKFLKSRRRYYGVSLHWLV